MLLIFVLPLLASCLFGCHGDYYFTKDGIYYSSAPFIELNCPKNSGTMEIDGVIYQLGLAFENNGTKIYIENRELYNQMPTDSNGNPIIFQEDVLLWQADTKTRNGKLYLTVTKDNISNYEGKTIILEFTPNEG